MKFDAHGGFEIPIDKKTRHVMVNDTFWTTVVEKIKGGLSAANGCYVFALRFGKKITPWYVGKTEKGSFATACFRPANKVIFNEILVQHRGTPLLFLIPRLTPIKTAFAKAGENYSTDRLETILIGCALQKNYDLANRKKTKIFREMHVPGIINHKGKLAKSASALKSALKVSLAS